MKKWKQYIDQQIRGNKRRKTEVKRKKAEVKTNISVTTINELNSVIRQKIHKVTKQILLHAVQKIIVQSLSCVQLFAPHGLQHARLPCPSPAPGICSDSYPLSQWCHPSISSSVTPFSSYPQSFPASGSFPDSALYPT